MTKKRKRSDEDQKDQPGSRGGKGEESPRETVHPSFAIRLTYEKVDSKENWDQWISGSVEPPDIFNILSSEFEMGRIALEEGAGGQKHFQITVGCFKTRKRRQTVRNFLETHYDKLQFPKLDYCEPCLGTWKSLQYCAKKDCTSRGGPWDWGLERRLDMDLKDSDLPEPKEFQKTIMERHSEDAGNFNTKIHWYCDYEGQIGKTMTARMLILKHGFYLLDGAAEKMKFQAAKNPAKGYVLNIPRSKESRFSYTGLESISDGVYCDTFGSDQKGMVCRKGSHLVCFANWMPQLSMMTESRWEIYEYDKDKNDFVVKGDEDSSEL